MSELGVSRLLGGVRMQSDTVERACSRWEGRGMARRRGESARMGHGHRDTIRPGTVAWLGAGGCQGRDYALVSASVTSEHGVGGKSGRRIGHALIVSYTGTRASDEGDIREDR